jgi:hypothetical protein
MDYETTLADVAEAMNEPSSPQDLAQDQVARAVRDAYMATAELYKLRIDPKTAALVAREEGELWAIQSRVTALLNEIRAEHA